MFPSPLRPYKQKERNATNNSKHEWGKGHSGIFDEKLSHAQKIQSSRELKNGENISPNLIKLGYRLGVYLRANHAKKF